ncbi:MAG: hypothetical protein KGL39_10325 [Patescibacteria group bacterium]|nr:hypothetical protein [Patescibacteria group bacterium]
MKKQNKLAQNDFQQGDVLGVRIKSMPSGEQKIIARKRLVVAHGESGHSHVIEDNDAELIQIGERMILNLKKNATIVHEEHGSIELKKGIWDVGGRVQEYDWFSKMQRQVID